jgi:threonine/homoserine/homoserine lactone efflux protein
MLDAIAAGVPAAVAVALSPFPVIGVVLILAGPNGRRSGPLFAVGWIAGLSLVAVVTSVVFAGSGDAESTSSTVADVLRVVGGTALIAGGVRKWWTRPRGDVPATSPGWMATLDQATGRRALTIGALLSGANPKTIVLTASAVTSMIDAGASGSELVAAVAGFVLVGSCTVIGAVAVRLAGGERGAAVLDGVRRFMSAHATVITVVVLVLLGAKIVADGVAGLDRWLDR